MKKLFALARAMNLRFPDGNSPYQITTRILEECGEVASEVDHFEGSGVKSIKHGEPDKHALAKEIRQSMMVLAQLAVYYDVEENVEQSVEAALESLREEGYVR